MLHKYFLFLDHFENNFFKNSITNLNIIYRNYTKQIKYSEILKLRSYCKKKKIKLTEKIKFNSSSSKSLA